MVFSTRRQLPSRRVFNVTRSIPKSPYLPAQRGFARVGRLASLWRTAKRLWRWLAPETAKSPEQETEIYLKVLRATPTEDVAAVLASAMLARKTLDTTRLVATPFPNAELSGETPLDEEAREHLVAYADELKRFQAICGTSGMTLGQSVAKGLDTWIMSVRALALPHLYDKGREAWALLEKGDDGVEKSYRFMLRRDITEVELGYLHYRPAALTPPKA